LNNIENDNYSNSYQDNVLYLEKLSEKYHASLVFLNLSEVNKINSITEEFITGCLKKKKEKMINLKKSKINKGSSNTDQLEKIQESMSIEENNSSPKKNKIGNCLIF
jgi:signal recognition particle receptor subunit beta